MTAMEKLREELELLKMEMKRKEEEEEEDEETTTLGVVSSIIDPTNKRNDRTNTNNNNNNNNNVGAFQSFFFSEEKLRDELELLKKEMKQHEEEDQMQILYQKQQQQQQQQQVDVHEKDDDDRGDDVDDDDDDAKLASVEFFTEEVWKEEEDSESSSRQKDDDNDDDDDEDETPKEATEQEPTTSTTSIDTTDWSSKPPLRRSASSSGSSPTATFRRFWNENDLDDMLTTTLTTPQHHNNIHSDNIHNDDDDDNAPNKQQNEEDDDDYLSNEIRRLSTVEQQLRQTLERSTPDSSTISFRFSSPPTHPPVESSPPPPGAKNLADETDDEDDPQQQHHHQQLQQQRQLPPEHTASSSSTHDESIRRNNKNQYGIRIYPWDDSLPTIPLSLSRHTLRDEAFGREYLSPPSSSILQTFFYPFSPSSSSSSSLDENERILRCCYIQIRPDVLCGAVMDAVSHATDCSCRSNNNELLKRQGGHLRARLWDGVGLDVQLCTRQTRECERVLLIRIVILEEGEGEKEEEGDDDRRNNKRRQQHKGMNEIEMETEEEDWIESAVNFAFRREECHDWDGGMGKDHVMNAIGQLWNPVMMQGILSPQKLLQDHGVVAATTATTTAETAEHVEYPCLSDEYVDLVRRSWRVIVEIEQELETRDLAYCTLSTTPFLTFPSLSTLDVHYCSQLRSLSHEHMIFSLLKTARELESFAKEAEHKCIILTKVLHPVLEAYRIRPISHLPPKKPLKEFPLPFTPPEELHPPWGKHVQTALDRISSKFVQHQTEMNSPERSVRILVAAFQRQDDEEMGARLVRKNVQVMDRLTKLHEYRKTIVKRLIHSYDRNEQATKAAHQFLKTTSSLLPPQQTLPLLTTSILLASPSKGYSSTTGTCIITPYQLHISITPFFMSLFQSSSQHHLVCLNSVKVDIWEMNCEETEGLLSSFSSSNNCHPNGVRLVSLSANEEEEEEESGKEILSFVPEIGAKRFRLFVEIIKDVMKEIEKEDGGDGGGGDVKDDGV